MRNAIVLIVVLVSLTLAGCGVPETQVASTETQVTNAKETAPETTTHETTSPTQTRNLDEELYQRLLKDCEDQSNSKEYPDTIENEILYKFLSRPSNGEYYVIVSPETKIWTYVDHAESYQQMENMKDGVIEWFAMFGYDISELYDKFLEINKNSQTLTLKSSVAEAYYIDYDSKFNQYLNELWVEIESEDYDFWNIMKSNFPRFNGFYDVSMPAYDPDTGYVLIYSGYLAGPVLGMGELNLLKYEDGELTEIISDELWVS